MRENFRKLCEERDDIPLFQQAWWLDATAGDSWDAVLVEKGGNVEAALPFIVKKRYGLRAITQPALTQFLGPWLSPAPGKRAKQIAREKDLMQALIDQLPSHHIYRQNWSSDYQNWMPFFWRGFSQTTRYSYQLNDLSDLDQVWGGFQENIRREIRKATKQGVTVSRIDDIDDFLALNKKVFERQGRRAPYTEDFAKNIDMAAAKKGQRAIFMATDQEGKRHAAVYLVWDRRSAYYLMGGGDPALRNSGATSLCMWEAIKFSSTVTQKFDFEGSMIEPIERFFRAFGGEPVPFFSVSHVNSHWLKMAIAFKEMV